MYEGRSKSSQQMRDIHIQNRWLKFGIYEPYVLMHEVTLYLSNIVVVVVVIR